VLNVRPTLPEEWLMPRSPQALWEEFLRSESEDAAAARGAPYAVWAFGDSAELADRLVSLVIAGPKRATCGSLEAYTARGDSVPEVGEYSVVLDGVGEARCVLQTSEVRIVAFEDVDAAFANDEGEGDRSLGSWRQGHMAYFERELHGLGLSASLRMPLVCERFRLLFVGGQPAT
jgi:uncharacterized protein YhfF